MMRTETITRQRAVETPDPYNPDNPSVSWEDPDELDITTLAPAEPRPSGEPVQDARNAVTSGWTLYLPEAADVASTDRVVVRGVVYNVMGEPAAWLGRGLVVQVDRKEG